MTKKEITSWRDLTLLQLGFLMKDRARKNGRLREEWADLLSGINRAEAYYRQQENAAGRKWSGFSINTTGVLLAYFLTFAAAVHRRFVSSGQNVSLETLVREYHLDLLTQADEKFSFYFFFGGLIPHNVATDSPEMSTYVDKNGGLWRKRTDEECVNLAWKCVTGYLAKKDAPGPYTRAEDAFAWLKEHNLRAYRPVYAPDADKVLFNFNYECNMEKAYPRFLQQMDEWNPCCVRLWSAFEKSARIHIRQLSAALNGIPDEKGDRGESRHA